MADEEKEEGGRWKVGLRARLKVEGRTERRVEGSAERSYRQIMVKMRTWRREQWS